MLSLVMGAWGASTFPMRKHLPNPYFQNPHTFVFFIFLTFSSNKHWWWLHVFSSWKDAPFCFALPSRRRVDCDNFLISKFNHRLLGWFSNLICNLKQFREIDSIELSLMHLSELSHRTSFAVTVIIWFALVWWIGLMLLILNCIVFLFCSISWTLFLCLFAFLHCRLQTVW